MNKNERPASNPYVYPSDKFLNHSKPLAARFEESRSLSELDIVEQLQRALLPLEVPQGDASKDAAEQILNILTDPNVCFGGVENILQDKADWLQRIKHFTDANAPLSFTIHGFPFKMPVPVKTNRRLPDLGDYASLFALNRLMDTLTQTYKPGAKLTVICEDGFAPFMGIKPEDARDYCEVLRETAGRIGFQNLRFVTISEMEKSPNYKKIFEGNSLKLQERYKAGDVTFVEQYNKVFPVLFRIVNTMSYKSNEDNLVAVYNQSESREGLQDLRLQHPELGAMIDDISERTHAAIIAYFAYLLTRDDLDFVQEVAPDSLPLSVSPKRGRLGIFPIERAQTKLPYHAVPMIEGGRLSMHYLYDLVRHQGTFQPVHLEGDTDEAPFYYEKTA